MSMIQSAEPQLIRALQARKQQGMSPQQAVNTMGQPATVATGESFDLRALGSAGLAHALREVYADTLTALATAIILRGQGYPAREIAGALAVPFPGLGALALGGILLNPHVCPQTLRPDLTSALTDAGYPAEQAMLAANILYPSQIAVLADRPWQSTGVQISGTQTTTIAYLSGSWFAGPGAGFCTGTGAPQRIAGEGYALPGAPESALLGRVGDRVFLIGNAATVPPGLAGLLELCINDDLDGLHGPGLADNRGGLLVKVSTSA